jgi:hypothetical protein
MRCCTHDKLELLGEGEAQRREHAVERVLGLGDAVEALA